MVVTNIMYVRRMEAARLGAYVGALLILFPSTLFSQKAAVISHNQLRRETERKVEIVAKQFAEILAPTPRETRLRVACRRDCSAVENSSQGSTVAEELDKIEKNKWLELSRSVAEINADVDTFLIQAFTTNHLDLDPKSIADDLHRILSTVVSQSPVALVLGSQRSHTLLVIYNVQFGPMTGDHSSSLVLRAYNADNTTLTFSDSIGSDMDGYVQIEIKELPSPIKNEIWLLASGQMSGANGPNIRMRIFAYNGKNLRTVWMPANEWGYFTTSITHQGFNIDGDYYRSSFHRHDQYELAADGLYVSRIAK